MTYPIGSLRDMKIFDFFLIYPLLLEIAVGCYDQTNTTKKKHFGKHFKVIKVVRMGVLPGLHSNTFGDTNFYKLCFMSNLTQK